MGLHLAWMVLIALSFSLPQYHLSVGSTQDCDLLINSVSYQIAGKTGTTLKVSSGLKDFREGNCQETLHVCAAFCDISKQYAVAGILFSLISTLTVALVGLCSLHLVYLVFVRPIALTNVHYVHLSAAVASLVSGTLHLGLSGAIGLSEATAGSGALCCWAAMATAACCGGHFLFLRRRGFNGLPMLKYTELGDTHMSMDAGRPTDLQVEITEPPDDKRHSKKELEEMHSRLQTSDDMRKSLMTDNQALTVQLFEKDKAVKELEQKLLRTQNNVQVTAALALAKQKEEEVFKLLNRLRDSDENNAKLAKSGEELRAKLKEKEATESKVRTDHEHQLRTMKLELAEVRNSAETQKADGQARETAELLEERMKAAFMSEKTAWNIEKQHLEEDVLSLKDTLTAREAELQTLKTSTHKHIQDLEREKARALSETGELKSAVKALQGHKEEMDTALRRAQETNTGLAELMEEVKRLKEEKNRLQSELGDHQRQWRELDSASKAGTESLQADISQKSTQIASLLSQIAKQTADLKEASDQRSKLQVVLTDTEVQLSKARETGETHSAASEALQGNIGQREAQIAALQSQVTDLTGELKRAKEEADRLQQVLEASDKQLAGLRETTQQSQSTHHTNIAQRDVQIATLQAQIAALTQAADGHKQAIETLQAKLTGLSEERSSLQKRYAVSESLQTELTAQRNTLSSEIATLQAGLKAKDADLAKTIEKVVELTELVDSLRTAAGKQGRDTEEERTRLRSEVEELRPLTVSLQAALELKGTEIASMQGQTKKLQAERSSLEAELTSLKAEWQQLQAANLPKQLSDAQTKASALEIERDSAVKSLETLKKDKEKLQQQLLSMISEHDSAEQQLHQLQGDYNQLLGKFGTESGRLNEEMEKLKEELQGKRAEMSKMSGKMQELTQQKNDANSNLMALLSEHEDMKREKEDLEQALQFLRSQKSSS